jgi:CRISPR-associated protein Csb2
LPYRKAEIDRVLVGRRPDGQHDGPTSERVRIIPLPSIGHSHADRAIRRVLVEVPSSCPFRPEDIAWAFSGLELIDVETGEAHEIVLTPTDSVSMWRHYGVGEGTETCTWRTVTPVALPDAVGRRRIDPARKVGQAKGGAERADEQRGAAGAVVQAMRHVAVRARVEAIRVQREPFEARGERVEEFAAGTRFPHRRLWHVEVSFAEPVFGPLVVGDGRFLGLGVMAPISTGGGNHTRDGDDL